MVKNILIRYDVSIRRRKCGENEPACIMLDVMLAFVHTVSFLKIKIYEKDFVQIL